MAERLYTEEEVNAIFARATEVQAATPRQLPPTEGMSLVELQSIGREAGIAPELVAEAARTLDRNPEPQVPKFLGLEIGVAHTVELGRRLSDDEWERFVVQLRETFDARGKVHIEGSLRSWTNGNLNVLVEPSEDGHRVRFRTVRGEARPFMTVGLGLLGAATVTVIAALATTDVRFIDALYAVTGAGLMGVGFLAIGSLRLPSWTRTRREQMQRLGAKLLANKPTE